jgi:hypothetical protein
MCEHVNLVIATEQDRCHWVYCAGCSLTGPKKNTRTLALIAFAMKLPNQHPRPKKRRVIKRGRVGRIHEARYP